MVEQSKIKWGSGTDFVHPAHSQCLHCHGWSPPTPVGPPTWLEYELAKKESEIEKNWVHQEARYLPPAPTGQPTKATEASLMKYFLQAIDKPKDAGTFKEALVRGGAKMEKKSAKRKHYPLSHWAHRNGVEGGLEEGDDDDDEKLEEKEKAAVDALSAAIAGQAAGAGFRGAAGPSSDATTLGAV